MVWVLGRLRLLVCPAFPLLRAPGRAGFGDGRVSGGGWWAGGEHGVPERGPGLGPGPVGRRCGAATVTFEVSAVTGADNCQGSGGLGDKVGVRSADGSVIQSKGGDPCQTFGAAVPQLPVRSFALAVAFSTRFGLFVVPYRRGSGRVTSGMGALVVGPSW